MQREIEVSLVLLMSFFSSRQYDILLSEILLFKKFHSRSYFTLYQGRMVKPSRLEKTQSECYLQRTFSQLYKSKWKKVVKVCCSPNFQHYRSCSELLPVYNYVLNEHNYAVAAIQKLKKMYDGNTSKGKKFQNQSYSLKAQKRKLVKIIASLESVIVEIKYNFSLPEETLNLLHSSSSKILEDLFQRVIKKLKYSDCRDKYHCSSPIVCLARLFFFKTSDWDCRLIFFKFLSF